MPAPVVHFEIGCKNIEATRKFYSSQFGWEYAPGAPNMALIGNLGSYCDKPTPGIGGHINPIDDAGPLFGDYRAMYEAAVEREVTEEVAVEAGHKDHVVALLNDDSNEVGKVHLGVVHCWVLDAPKVSRREQMITQMEFMSVDELRAVRDQMETWSQLCLDGLDPIREKLKEV